MHGEIMEKKRHRNMGGVGGDERNTLGGIESDATGDEGWRGKCKIG